MTMQQIGTTSDRTALNRFFTYAKHEARECRFNVERQVERDGEVTTMLVMTSPTFNGSVRLSGESNRFQFGRN